jgi:hypothetical protein
MTFTSRTLSAALAATLVLAACGSDDNDTDDTTTTVAATETTVDAATESTTATTAATDTTTTTEASAQDADADTAAAQAALLTLAELPEGWTETPSDTAAAAEVEGRIAKCIGSDGLSATETHGVSATFISPDGNLIVNEHVDVLATDQDARSVVANLTNPDVPSCVAAAYTELGAAAVSAGAVADGAEFGEATAGRLAVGAAGDATQAIRITIPVTAGGTATQLTVDQLFTRAGRSLASLIFVNRLDATPVEVIDEIAAAAASRLPG